MTYMISEITETFGPEVDVPRRMDLKEKFTIVIEGETQVYRIENVSIEMLPWQTQITYTLISP